MSHQRSYFRGIWIRQRVVAELLLPNNNKTKNLKQQTKEIVTPKGIEPYSFLALLILRPFHNINGGVKKRGRGKPIERLHTPRLLSPNVKKDSFPHSWLGAHSLSVAANSWYTVCHTLFISGGNTTIRYWFVLCCIIQPRPYGIGPSTLGGAADLLNEGFVKFNRNSKNHRPCRNSCKCHSVIWPVNKLQLWDSNFSLGGVHTTLDSY